MKRIVTLFGIAILILALGGIALTGCTLEDIQDLLANAPQLETAEPEAEGPETEEPDADAEEPEAGAEVEEPGVEEPGAAEVVSGPPGMVWRVQPTLEHSHIFHCAYCNFFAVGDHSGRLIDRATGELAGDNPGTGHGRAGNWAYDPGQGLFGIVDYSGVDLFPFAELSAHFPWATGLMAVTQVDSTVKGETGFFLAPGAFSGRYAVMYNGRFVTEFIFDAYEPWSGSITDNTIAIRRDGRWGMVDQNGGTVIPFVFEHIVTDGTTVFARYDGRYGILDVAASR